MLNAPIRRRRLHEDVSERIEETILSGRLQPGDALPSERELMVAFQVGRPAVREALLTLQKSGLVKVGNGERAKVSAPTAASILGELSSAARFLLLQENGVRHFQQARAMFEVGLARAAAEHASEADIDRLAAALSANKASVDDLDAMERTDVAFHFVLAEITANPIFTALHDALVAWLREQRSTSLRSKGAARAAYAAHRKIFEAIRRHDVEQAGAAMQAHLTAVARYYWSAASTCGDRTAT